MIGDLSTPVFLDPSEMVPDPAYLLFFTDGPIPGFTPPTTGNFFVGGNDDDNDDRGALVGDEIVLLFSVLGVSFKFEIRGVLNDGESVIPNGPLLLVLLFSFLLKISDDESSSRTVF